MYKQQFSKLEWVLGFSLLSQEVRGEQWCLVKLWVSMQNFAAVICESLNTHTHTHTHPSTSLEQPQRHTHTHTLSSQSVALGCERRHLLGVAVPRAAGLLLWVGISCLPD